MFKNPPEDSDHGQRWIKVKTDITLKNPTFLHKQFCFSTPSWRFSEFTTIYVACECPQIVLVSDMFSLHNFHISRDKSVCYCCFLHKQCISGANPNLFLSRNRVKSLEDNDFSFCIQHSTYSTLYSRHSEILRQYCGYT